MTKRRLFALGIVIGAILVVGCSIVGKKRTVQTQEKSIADLAEKLIGKDGAPMVLIPAGEFQMGSDDENRDEKPAHIVYLDAFYLDVYEVTNAQYRRFVQATGHDEPVGNSFIDFGLVTDFKPWSDDRFNGDDQPVVCVSWEDAKAYCQWAGKRLPTEAEWEKAARGRLMDKKYPWGDDITRNDANYGGTGDKDKWEYSAPVGSFAANGYGLYDMAGNAWEWCADWYDKNYYASSPKHNPTGPDSGENRMIRGGGWFDEPAYQCVTYRFKSKRPHASINLGFRCAKDAKP